VVCWKELIQVLGSEPMLHYTKANLSSLQSASLGIFEEMADLLPPEMSGAFACNFDVRGPGEPCSGCATIPCQPRNSSDKEAVQEYLRTALISSNHYFGTASAGAVVGGEDFAVKGVRGLYVVDSSVIPYPTTLNPQGTVMALAHYIGTRLAASAGQAGGSA